MSDSIETICGNILTGISNSPSVAAFVTANFPGKTLQLYLGLDVNQLPVESMVPWCAAIPRSTGRDDNNQARQRNITMGIVIKSATVTDVGAYTKMAGYGLMEQLAELIQDNILNTLNGNILNLSSIDFEVDFPYFRCSFSFNVPEETD